EVVLDAEHALADLVVAGEGALALRVQALAAELVDAGRQHGGAGVDQAVVDGALRVAAFLDEVGQAQLALGDVQVGLQVGAVGDVDADADHRVVGGGDQGDDAGAGGGVAGGGRRPDEVDAAEVLQGALVVELGQAAVEAVAGQPEVLVDDDGDAGPGGL